MRLRYFDHSAANRAGVPAVLKGVGLVSLAIVLLLLLPAGPFGAANSAPAGPSPVVPVPATVATASLNISALPPSASPAPPSTNVSATINVDKPIYDAAVPSAFWGTNVLAENGFGSSDAVAIENTPARYIRFPGGTLGDEFNYTSGVITNPDGSTTKATVTVQAFITVCHEIGCSAIFQLPAEINNSKVAAYYANYVVKTLGFQPAYWEIGNSPPSWTHYNVPWSHWSTTKGDKITPTAFAQTVGSYIKAVKAVDPKAHFTALALGAANYDKTWISTLAQLEGKNLSGISIHSYTMGSSPANPTWADLLANLNGQYGLATQVNLTRGYIKAACPTCTTKVFVTESNAAEVNNYTALDSTFAGTLYVAAATIQALHLRLANLDWFCYSCNFGGSWKVGSKDWSQQYTLFSQMMTQLGANTLWTTVSGPSTFYATATYGVAGLAILMVNANVTSSVSVNLSHTGIISGSIISRERWVNGSAGPTNSSFTLGGSVTAPPMSISIISAPPGSVIDGTAMHAAHRAGHQSSASHARSTRSQHNSRAAHGTDSAPAAPGSVASTPVVVSPAAGCPVPATRSPSAPTVPRPPTSLGADRELRVEA